MATLPEYSGLSRSFQDAGVVGITEGSYIIGTPPQT